MDDFRKYATKHLGMSSLVLENKNISAEEFNKMLA